MDPFASAGPSPPGLAEADLSGVWRAAEADEGVRRAYPDPRFDDSRWAEVAVPGHWRSSPPFAASDGPILYRRRFGAPRPEAGRRRWLVLDGLFYQGDVWLDGSYLGDTEGYFAPHAFEVTEALRARTEHLLAVEVTCARQSDRRAKRNLTGVFQHWDCLDPDWNPGGIWRPVRLEETGPVRIQRLRLLCPEATPERATLTLGVGLDAAAATTVEIVTTVSPTGPSGRPDGTGLFGTEHRQERTLAAGENRVSWQVGVPRPALWWPHALGDQPLYDVAVAVVPFDGAPSDVRRLRTGLRQVRMKRWVASVNGERLFLKGSNQGPTRMALGEATPEELGRDVALAKEAGLDLLRLHGHVGRPELYDAADRAGLLVWQDLPLQWGYARGVRRQAVRQAREAVDLLGSHPSVAIWCGHNEPLALDVEPGDTDVSGTKLAVQFAVAQELPSWNKTVLDGSVKRALEKADPTRPVVAHSGVFPGPTSGGTDIHAYLGWYYGDERDLPKLLARWPRLARFVSEFGAQAVPGSDAFMEPERWPDLDWARLERTHGLQKALMERHAPPAGHDSLDSWRRATQEYQAAVVKSHVEALRRLKYRPTGGFCQFSFADSHPAVTWAVLDSERVPKLGHAALAAACAPVIVVADRLEAAYAPGEALALDVHVVSDLRGPIEGGVVTARLAWAGGEHAWRWAGDVPADACARIGTVQAVVPDAEGPLALTLELVASRAKAENRYDSRIARRDGRVVRDGSRIAHGTSQIEHRASDGGIIGA